MGMGIKTGDRAFESKSKWESKSKTGTSLSIKNWDKPFNQNDNGNQKQGAVGVLVAPF